MNKKQRRKSKRLMLQQINYLKKDRAYRTCTLEQSSNGYTFSGGRSNFSDNIYPSDPRWSEDQWKKRYDAPNASLSFSSGTYKITTATIHTITIGNHTQEFISNERVLFDQEKSTNGDFSLVGKGMEGII